MSQELTLREAMLAGYNLGFPSLAKVGSCALVTLVINSKLYVANIGDCQGVLFRRSI